jgi:hypothetical protein
VSLIRAVIRLCAVQAVIDANTMAQARVYDSNNKPLLDILDVGEKAGEIGPPLPFVSIYTDSDNLLANTLEHGIYSASHATQIMFELGVASALRTEKGDKILYFPHTDDAMELSIDFLQTQVLAAVVGDPRNEWAELIRDITIKPTNLTSMRSGRMQQGSHWAARQVTYTIDTISDVAPGMAIHPQHVIKRFIALAKDREAPGTVDAAMLIETMIDNQNYASWEQVQMALGITRRGLRGIGIAPLTDVGVGSTPFATEVGESVVVPETREAPMLTEVFGQGQPPLAEEVYPEGDPEIDVKPHVDTDPNAP